MITDQESPIQIQPTSPSELARPKKVSGKWHIIDLILLDLLAFLLPLIVQLDLPLVRLPLALGMVLLAPGYVLTIAFFPRASELNGSTRLALSFGLSIVVVGALALLLSFLPWGLHFWPVVISVSAWIVAINMVGGFRRYRQREVRITGLIPWWELVGWQVILGLLATGLLVGVVLIYCVAVLTAPDPSNRLTEFYVLNASGLVEDYPRQAAPNQPVQVKLGVVNREEHKGSYRIEIRNDGKLLKEFGPFQLANGERWEQPVEFSLSQPGKDQIIELWLFNDQSTQPYRQLRLWINVE